MSVWLQINWWVNPNCGIVTRREKDLSHCISENNGRWYRISNLLFIIGNPQPIHRFFWLRCPVCWIYFTKTWRRSKLNPFFLKMACRCIYYHFQTPRMALKALGATTSDRSRYKNRWRDDKSPAPSKLSYQPDSDTLWVWVLWWNGINRWY